MIRRLMTMGAVLLAPLTPAFGQTEAEVELTMIYHSSVQSWDVYAVHVPWVQEIEKASGGRIKFDTYWGETFAKGDEQLDAVRSGAADITVVYPGFEPGLFNLTPVIELAFLPVGGAKEANALSYMLYETFPEIRKEFEDLNTVVLYFQNAGPYVPMLTEKAGPIKNLADWNGKKIRALPGPQQDAVEALGGSPLYVPMTDIYVASQRATIDGILMPYNTVVGEGMAEVHRYFTDVPVAYAAGAVVMNLTAWNELPQDLQKIMMDAGGGRKRSEFAGDLADNIKSDALKEMERLAAEKGYPPREVIEIPDEEMERWAEKARPTWDAWVTKMEGLGYQNARMILDELLKQAEAYN
jgi:TRAP-type C4-dicarboxylate transport system substrate-binding protein